MSIKPSKKRVQEANDAKEVRHYVTIFAIVAVLLMLLFYIVTR